MRSRCTSPPAVRLCPQSSCALSVTDVHRLVVRPGGAWGAWGDRRSQESPSQDKRYKDPEEARGGYVALTQRGRAPLGGAVMDASCAQAPATRIVVKRPRY